MPSTVDTTVDDLLARVREGAEDAATSLVSLCGARLFQYGKIAAPHVSDADLEDLCARSVEQAVLRLDRYDPARASFYAWLRGFLRREIYEHSRRSKQTWAGLDDESLPLMAWPGTGSPSDDAIEPGRHHDVREAFARLSDTDQLLLTLRVHEALPFASIAERLGATEASCRQRYRRALTRLRNELNPQTEERP